MIGPRCSFLASSHPVSNNPLKRAATGFSKPITVEDGCWIGAHVVVLPGITIARGCVIAAGAVLTKDTELDGLYAGVPAKRVKNLNARIK